MGTEYLLKSLQDLPACCDQTLKSRAVAKQNKHKLSVLSSAQHPASCPADCSCRPRGSCSPGPCQAGGTTTAPEARHSATLMCSEQPGVSQFVLPAGSCWPGFSSVQPLRAVGAAWLPAVPEEQQIRTATGQEGQPQAGDGGAGLCPPALVTSVRAKPPFSCAAQLRSRSDANQKNYGRNPPAPTAELSHGLLSFPGA